MGANVSVSEKTLLQTITNQMSASCQNVGDTEQTIEGVKILARGCKIGDISLQNKSVREQSCDMNTVVTSLADAMQTTDLKQSVGIGLGVNASSDKQDIELAIKTKLDAECGSTEKVRQRIQNNNIDLSAVCYGGILGIGQKCFPCEAENISLINESNSHQQCVQSAVAEATSRAKQASKTDQTVDLLGSLGLVALLGLLPCIIIVIIIIIIVSKAGKGKSTAGATGTSALGATGATGTGTTGSAGAAGAAAGAVNKQNLQALGKGMQNLKGFFAKGGGKKSSGSGVLHSMDQVPIVVYIIMALVLYASTH